MLCGGLKGGSCPVQLKFSCRKPCWPSRASSSSKRGQALKHEIFLDAGWRSQQLTSSGHAGGLGLAVGVAKGTETGASLTRQACAGDGGNRWQLLEGRSLLAHASSTGMHAGTRH